MFMLILTHFIFRVRVYVFQVCLLACRGEQKKNMLKNDWVTLSQKVHVLLSHFTVP